MPGLLESRGENLELRSLVVLAVRKFALHITFSMVVELNRANRRFAAAAHSLSVGRRRPMFGVFICQFGSSPTVIR